MSEHALRVDWPACRARGICHELAPEVIDLDPWGYPIVTGSDSGRIAEEHLQAARDAVAGCPRQALRLSGPTSLVSKSRP